MSPESGRITADFLRSIWPEGHTYCIAVKAAGKGGMRQSFFRSIDEAAAFALLASQRGFDVYHACAAFLSADSRKATNVAAVKAFWLDVDVGPNKPYADDRAALAAILQFSQAVSWPLPTIIHSGGGWHVYWTLLEALPPAVWAPFAEALRNACVAHGLHADHGITIDVARILRPVGTLNFKREQPAPVTLRHAAAPVSVRDLVAGLQPPRPAIPNIPGVDNSKFEVKVIHADEPSYASRIVSGCQQLAHFRDSKGRVDEPFWYASLCLLGHCEDGGHFAHEWSKGDERYIYADTEKKLEQGRKNSGPTTCERFGALNPTGCAGCPHFSRITSPIQIGRGGAPKDTSVGDVNCPTPPSPFKRSSSGALLVNKANEEGVNETSMVYKAPLFLAAIRKSESAETTTLIVKHWLPHEGWHEAVVPWHDRSQKTVINSMAAQNINVPRANERDMLWFLELSIDEFQSHRKTDMEYAQFGWREDFQQFVFGNDLYISGQEKPTPVGAAQELTIRARSMKAYGTFEAWRSAAQPLFVYEQQGLMVVAGFASVLMRFAQEMTGVIVAAVSPEPRLGKTMGLVAARSIWGDDNAIDIATNDTANSRFKMLAVLNGLPATWDDMRKSNDPEIIKQFVLSFSQGRDKNRLDKGGHLRTNISGWSSILLATSNISIAELVGHDGETAQQARILEYRFQPMPGMKYSDGQQYERILRQNRGQAGRKFLQALMLPGMVEWCRQSVPMYVREFETALNRSDASFYATFLGCVKAASIILNRANILEFSTDRLLAFAVKKAQQMALLMVENQTDVVEMIAKFINDNWQNTLVVADAWKAKTEANIRKLPQGKLHIRYEMLPNRLYIDRTALKEWCRPRNIMFRDLSDRLSAQSIVIDTHKRVNLGAGTPLSGAGQVQCFELDAGHPDLGNLRLVTELPDPTQVPDIRRRVAKVVLVPGKIQDAR